MDGLRATRDIRGLSRADAAAVPIIAMTADAFAEEQEQTRQAGMNAHLSKPSTHAVCMLPWHGSFPDKGLLQKEPKEKCHCEPAPQRWCGDRRECPWVQSPHDRGIL